MNKERIDPEWILLAERWKSLQLKKKELEAHEKECREQILALTTSDEVQGGGIKVSRHTRKGRIAYEDIPILQEMDLEPYRGEPVDYWMISVQKKRS
jgi:hypothetical protein